MAREYYTIAQAAQEYGCNVATVYNTLNGNKHVFQEGVHYFRPDNETVRRLKESGEIPIRAKGVLKLLTPEGYALFAAIRDNRYNGDIAAKPKQDDSATTVAKIKAAFYQRQYEQACQYTTQVQELTGQLLDERQRLLDERQRLIEERGSRVDDLQRRVKYLEGQNETMLAVISKVTNKG